MCGISGLVRPEVLRPKDITAVEHMTAAMRHRGPDADGFLRMGSALGMRRLRIIDLDTGDQPIYNEDGTIAVILNGEIYNYQDLRRDLEARGHTFRTRSDTEAIVHAYEEWGGECVKQLRGMFAFAILDMRKGIREQGNKEIRGKGWSSGQYESEVTPPDISTFSLFPFSTLFLARDRLGIKPLYYYHHNGLFLFASEVRALLASELVPRCLDLHGLRSYLAYGSVQDPLTLIQGVRSLLPGHFIHVSAQDGELQCDVRRYWHLPGPETVAPETPSDMLSPLYEHLSEAVHLRLIADVPLGAFLSGGIDSTAVAALMKQGSNGPVKTFSVVFDQAAFDERPFSRRAAEHIGTEHTELHLSGADVRAELPRALAAFDQPSLDGLNTYFVSKVTKEAGLTVALSGLGGDELFGGYEGYRKTLQMERWGGRLQALPAPLRSGLRGLLRHAPRNEPIRKADEILRNSHIPYFSSRLLFSTIQVAELLHPDLLASSAAWAPPRFQQLAQETAGYDPINRASALELQTYMLSTLLRDTDQMSMAHALEVRVPLIDHLLVEFVMQLPGNLKIRNPQPFGFAQDRFEIRNTDSLPKPLLTGALNGAIPPECIYRPKMGFVLPFEIWLRQALQPQMEAMFYESGDGPDLFRPEALQSLWAQFRSGRINWSRVWALFVLQEWLTRCEIRL